MIGVSELAGEVFEMIRQGKPQRSRRQPDIVLAPASAVRAEQRTEMAAAMPYPAAAAPLRAWTFLVLK